ncbi:MAG: 50S ribosomal protein L22 [Aggregatilineales bacterium]
MEVRAIARGLPISAQKVRLVCDEVRGKDADQALAILRFMPKKGARFLSKLIESAVANAENNYELNRNDLFVSQVFAGEGPQMKRMKAGSRGRYKPRIKRSAHVTVILAEHELEAE